MSYTFNSQVQASVATSVNSLAAPSITPNAGDLLIVVVAATNYEDFASGAITISDTAGNTWAALAIPQATQTTALTFSTAPSGATSGTLSANWASSSGSYFVIFSDAETRVVTFTNGSTACSWAGALGTVTTAASVGTLTALGMFVCYNAKGSATVITAADSHTTFIQAIYVADYSGLGNTSAALLGTNGNYQADGGTVSANYVTSGALSGVAVNAMQFGLSANLNNTAPAYTAGTSPTAYTGRSTVWSTWLTNSSATPEDAAVSSNVAATWGNATATEFDASLAISAAFALSTGAGGPPPRMNYQLPPLLAQ